LPSRSATLNYAVLTSFELEKDNARQGFLLPEQYKSLVWVLWRWYLGYDGSGGTQ
jgi:hypothetical protein